MEHGLTKFSMDFLKFKALVKIFVWYNIVMFKCSECGCEYDQKPDFCDCGNNMFDEINDTPAKAEKPKFNINKSEILSWIIFFVCILLSVLVLIFFPKVDPQKQNKPTTPIKEAQIKDIPNLNSFWIDCKPVVEEDTEKTAEPIKEVLNIFKPTPKPQTKPQNQKSVQSQQNKTTPQKNTTQQQVKKQTPQPSVKKPQTAKTTTTDIELLNYINGLLNRFKSNLVLADIDGEGSCIVEFGLDGNGKLINRNFSRLSENKSVNDAVYKMMMRTPVYNAPPSSYNGQKLRVYIKLSPSYYEISLIK